MSDIVRDDRSATDRLPTEEKNSSVNYYVIGAVVLAMLALLAYQTFGCADCYAPI
jgi:hypothetical protein